jgi:hypothetical protein
MGDEEGATMGHLLLWVGRLAGTGGVILCAAAFAGRLSGTWFLGNFQIGTILLAGIAGMVLGCLAYCASLAERPRR